jgi:hypothetical protein
LSKSTGCDRSYFFHLSPFLSLSYLLLCYLCQLSVLHVYCFNNGCTLDSLLVAWVEERTQGSGPAPRSDGDSGAMGGLASGECMRQQPSYRRNPMVEINNTLEGNDKSNLNFYATSCKWYCRIKLIDPTVIDGYRNSVTTPSP